MRIVYLILAIFVLSLPVNAQFMKTDGAAKEMVIAGKTMSCFGADLIWDSSLPSEGAGTVSKHPSNGILWMNKRMLAKWPEQVQWFVFAHECGHLHNIESELQADAWAVKYGVEQGWLTKEGTQHVCLSFEDAPATRDHPSGERRCREIFKLYDELTANTVPPPPIEKTDTTPKFEIKPWWKRIFSW